MARLTTQATYPGVRDRELDGPRHKVASSVPARPIALEIAARVGLALFLTAGSPNLHRACEGFFLWALALVSCGSSRRT